MHIRSLRYLATLLLSGALFTILVGMASVWFVRSLGQIIASLAHTLGLDAATADTVSEIFGQLKGAELNLPLECTGVACFLLCAAAILFLAGHKKSTAPVDETSAKPVKTKKTGRIVLVCVLGLVLFLPLTAVTIWFTEVNYVRFDRVIQSLLPLLQSGLF